MAYQFIHIETYAKISNKNNKKQSIFGIAKEAERAPCSCSHVTNPQPPKTFGKSPSEIAKMAVELASKSTDPRGRKIRKDGQILLAGVASYPVRMEDLKNADDEVKEHFSQWLRLTREFLRGEYGAQLQGHVVHLDEEFPHVHFYVLPEPCESGFLHIRSVHCGMAARDTVHEKMEGAGKARARLYKAAMRSFQDRYYEHVGKPCGLARTGPKRDRLTRKEWKQEQERMKRIALELKESNERSDKFDEAQDLLDRKIDILENKKLEIKQAAAQAAELEDKAIQAEKSAKHAQSLAIKEQKEAANIKSEGFFSGFSSTIQFFKKKAAEFESKYNKLKKRCITLESTIKEQSQKIRNLNSKLGRYESELRSFELKNNDLTKLNSTQERAILRLREQISSKEYHSSSRSCLDA
ncbi:hypothetical protein CBP31_03030 [Oceanisphaera profunda]|uniref:Uncharacterized protein n=1 Tax=Oceanisphaera profunda TaxID=1416627 RepID=A0A1Y0D3P5_9GAMM|nr:hypothetical protein [Oceanisphaera profunda]ART81725.1 hypothetical protein CBP31_03030 [Oceanisphaera profunda]